MLRSWDVNRFAIGIAPYTKSANRFTTKSVQISFTHIIIFSLSTNPKINNYNDKVEKELVGIMSWIY